MLDLHAILTLVSDATTLADVEDFVSEALRLGASLDDVILDGGNLTVVGFPTASGGRVRTSSSHTLGGLASWLEEVHAVGVPRWAEVTAGGELALDLPVVSATACEPPGEAVHVWVEVGSRPS